MPPPGADGGAARDRESGGALSDPDVLRVTVVSAAAVALNAASLIWHWPQSVRWPLVAVLAVLIVVQVIVIRRRTRA